MGAVLLELSLATAAIYFACEYFTNGVEWLGRRLNLSQTATGTLLAAFGTALPESVVTLIATAFGSSSAHRDIGVGSAMGGPLTLSTLGYGVIGLLAVRSGGARDGLARSCSLGWLKRDQIWFLSLFVVGAVLGVLDLAWKFSFGFIFLLAYALYVWRELNGSEGHAGAGELEPLAIRPRDREPGLVWIGLQLGLSLVVIFFASRAFVQELEAIGSHLGLSSQVTALLLSPIATEMPEMMNSIVWVRQGKVNLALANVSGAMMIQATIPAAFGMFFTPWLFEAPIMIAAAITILATAAALAVSDGRHSPAWTRFSAAGDQNATGAVGPEMERSAGQSRGLEIQRRELVGAIGDLQKPARRVVVEDRPCQREIMQVDAAAGAEILEQVALVGGRADARSKQGGIVQDEFAAVLKVDPRP
jgi:cation:H+ antiporter